MMISPSAFCAFYAALGVACHYHIYAYHIYDVSPFFSVINSIQKNSPNTVKLNFPTPDIVWCGKSKVNVVK